MTDSTLVLFFIIFSTAVPISFPNTWKFAPSFKKIKHYHTLLFAEYAAPR